MKIDSFDFSNLVFHISDTILNELITFSNHIDDIIIYNYIKAFNISTIHFYLLKLNKSDLWNTVFNNYINILTQNYLSDFNTCDSTFTNELLDLFDSSLALIETIYIEHLDTIKDHLSLEKIHKSILLQLIFLLNKKHNTDINLNIDKFSIMLTYCYDTLEDIILNKK